MDRQNEFTFNGDLVEIIESSNSRVTPPCKHYGVCGACDWLHIDYNRMVHVTSNQILLFFSCLSLVIYFDRTA
jgi:tRNA/tmRNA/rRNA uracil-C5-methylase (TrmA/RlmC/RlmD family)